MVRLVLPQWKEADQWLDASMKVSAGGRGRVESTASIPTGPGMPRIHVSAERIGSNAGENEVTAVTVRYSEDDTS